MNIADTEIIGSLPEFADKELDVRISLVNGDASIGVYDVQSQECLVDDFIAVEELTNKKIQELIERADVERKHMVQAKLGEYNPSQSRLSNGNVSIGGSESSSQLSIQQSDKKADKPNPGFFKKLFCCISRKSNKVQSFGE